jgi:dihydroorotate dehydrogenase
MYEYFLKPIFFLFDPERMHDFFVWFGEKLGTVAPARAVVHFFCYYQHPSLHTRVAGIDFENPIGLGAGFDKDVHLTKIMPAVGFGFMEVGAITRWPYVGNDGTRLARLPADNSLIVYYGLKNIGAEAVIAKLPRLQNSVGQFTIPVGVNIAKTNRADIKGLASVEDYAASYRMLSPHFSYVTINVSCPNAQDGTLFQDPAMLDGLLAALAREEKKVSVFLKISNHLSTAEVDDILAVVGKYPFVDGFVIGNLSKRRDEIVFKSSSEQLNVIPQGGISGAPIREMSTNLIRHIYSKTNASGGKYIIIGLGGVFTAEDAYEKILAGASLVQMVTGLIYGGPMAVKRINKDLVKLLERDGYAHVRDAVGREAKRERRV